MNFIDITKYKAAKTATELGKTTEELLVAYFDQRKKKEWSEELTTQYGVSKKNKVVPIKKNRFTRLGFLSIAAAFLIILVALPFLMPSFPSTTTKELVAMHANTPYQLNSARKSVEAKVKNIKIDKDDFLLGMNYYNNQNWGKTIEYLEKARPKYKDTLKYYDIQWYLSLAYYLTNQEDKSIDIWKEFEKKPKSGYYKRVKDLLNAQ